MAGARSALPSLSMWRYDHHGDGLIAPISSMSTVPRAAWLSRFLSAALMLFLAVCAFAFLSSDRKSLLLSDEAAVTSLAMKRWKASLSFHGVPGMTRYEWDLLHAAAGTKVKGEEVRRRGRSLAVCLTELRRTVDSRRRRD